jgi:hypothetical protein
VATEEEAEKVHVITLWVGSDIVKFEGILSALAEANVPCRFEQGLKLTPVYQLEIFGFTLWEKHSDSQNDYKVRIMKRDLKRARSAEREYFHPREKMK